MFFCTQRNIIFCLARKNCRASKTDTKRKPNRRPRTRRPKAMARIKVRVFFPFLLAFVLAYAKAQNIGSLCSKDADCNAHSSMLCSLWCNNGKCAPTQGFGTRCFSPNTGPSATYCQCGGLAYCDATSICTDQKEPSTPCDQNYECVSGICENGACSASGGGGGGGGSGGSDNTWYSKPATIIAFAVGGLLLLSLCILCCCCRRNKNNNNQNNNQNGQYATYTADYSAFRDTNPYASVPTPQPSGYQTRVDYGGQSSQKDGSHVVVVVPSPSAPSPGSPVH